MSDADLEALVGDLPPEEPRDDLRDEVLAKVHVALDAGAHATRRTTPFLSRRWPWAAAACLLIGLFVASLLLESGHARRTGGLRSAATSRRAAGNGQLSTYRWRPELLIALVRGESHRD